MRRREVLKSLLALPPVAWMMSCDGDSRPSLTDTSDASAVFEMSPTGFLVFVWSISATSALVRIRQNGEAVISRSVDLSDNGQGIVDVDGLTPDSEYSVEISYDSNAGMRSHVVRTALPEDSRRPVRFCVSADYDPAERFVNGVIDAVIAQKPEFFVSIGDFPYTDDGPVAETVDAYRQRHLDARCSPPLRALHEAVGVFAIYDDHEFRNNWDAMFVASEPDRYAAAMQVWDEFFPLRNARPEIRYRSWRWGSNLECFLLDCRRFRSADAAPNDASKTMLGLTQLDWFKSAMMSSTATFKVVFTSIPLDYGAGNDDWTNFTSERQLIFDFLATTGIGGVIFISGDQHWFAAQSHQYGIREIQIVPLARGFGEPPLPVPQVLFRNVDYNAGLVEVDDDHLTVSGIGPDGSVFYTETFTASDLTPTQAT